MTILKDFRIAPGPNLPSGDFEKDILDVWMSAKVEDEPVREVSFGDEFASVF